MDLDIYRKMRQGVACVEDIRPIANPSGICTRGPHLRKQHPTIQEDKLRHHAFIPPQALILPSDSPRAGVRGWSVESYFKTAACRHPFAVEYGKYGKCYCSERSVRAQNYEQGVRGYSDARQSLAITLPPICVDIPRSPQTATDAD